jgi:hypothetical protein
MKSQWRYYRNKNHTKVRGADSLMSDTRCNATWDNKVGRGDLDTKITSIVIEHIDILHFGLVRRKR